MLRTLVPALLLVLTTIAGAPMPSHASSSADDLFERLKATAATTSLDTGDLKPWHLKLDVAFYDAAGKPAEHGTVEEWWVSPKLNRVTYTTPSFSATELHTAEGAFRTRAVDSEPILLDEMLRQVVHPMPTEVEIFGTLPELRKEKFGPVPLECIMLKQPMKEIVQVPLSLFPTYCLNPGQNVLRAQMEFGSPTYTRNRIGTFQGRSIATQVSASTATLPSGEANVVALSTMAETAMDLAPAPDMEAIGRDAASVPGTVQAGNVLKKVPPGYPAPAKARRSSGTVILKAIIGRDGKIRNLHIVSTPDPDLAIAAILAVRQWLYKPYLLNGLPVEVSTTVTVNFKIG